MCGVDEAGRGPLAGPVVAAAVMLDPARPIDGLRDSKKLSAAARERLADAIRLRAAAWCIAEASVAEIDKLNFGDGKATAGWHAKEVKHNRQAQPSAELVKLQGAIVQALFANELIRAHALPRAGDRRSPHPPDPFTGSSSAPDIVGGGLRGARLAPRGERTPSQATGAACGSRIT